MASHACDNQPYMRDQAVRVALHIPAHVVARMAGVSRPTLAIYELDPLAVKDTSKRSAIERVYGELRAMISRFPTVSA